MSCPPLCPARQLGPDPAAPTSPRAMFCARILGAVDLPISQRFYERVPPPASPPPVSRLEIVARERDRLRRRRRTWLLGAVIVVTSAGLAMATLQFGPLGPKLATGPVTSPTVVSEETDPSAAEPPEQTPSPDPTVDPVPPRSDTPFMTPLSRAAVKSGEIDDPSSFLVVVNKQRPFREARYAPEVRRVLHTDHELRPEAAAPLEELLLAAEEDNVELEVLSGYRSFRRQHASREHAAQAYSKTRVEELSARPGYSEHQSGLAVDLGRPDAKCELRACFSETPAGGWLAENAHRFGFIIRYPDGQDLMTGYAFEPWHLRYVGLEAAAEIVEDDVPTLEDYFGLDPAPDY